MGTSATTNEQVGGKLRPLLSFFAELSERSKGAEDRISITKRVFFDGVVHGLRGEVLDREGTFLAAGDIHMVGAFVEGEAMGLAISDRLLPWRGNNWQTFRDMHTVRHPYELYTGLGMALGYLGARSLALKGTLTGNSLFEWFAIDGYAFQQALQDPMRYIHEQQRPRVIGLPQHAEHIMDQGIGRAFWFVFPGSATKIADAIDKFPAERRPHLWLGLGVAAAHTASVSKQELELLVTRSGEFRKHLVAGTLVAAHVRSRGGTRSNVTDRACYALAGMTSEEAAAIIEDAHDRHASLTAASASTTHASTTQDSSLTAASASTTHADTHAEWQSTILKRL